MLRLSAAGTAAEPARAAAAGAGVQARLLLKVVQADVRSSRARAARPQLLMKSKKLKRWLRARQCCARKARRPQPASCLSTPTARERVSYSDYSMPPLEFLNEAPPHSEQADAEFLSLATRLAEKCKEFNVTGQIKHICPGPVVTTYEFKPDPGR